MVGYPRHPQLAVPVHVGYTLDTLSLPPKVVPPPGSIRHNEVHNTVSGWLSEVCSDVCIEPIL